MVDHTYGVREVVGTSHDSVAQAIRNGVADAAKTIDRLDWFEVVEVRGHVENGEVGHFQVTMKVGFRLPDRADDRLDPHPRGTSASISRLRASTSSCSDTEV